MIIMRRSIIISLVLVSVLVIATACGTKDNEKTGGTEISRKVEFEKDAYKKIASPNNELGFKLLSEVEADGNDNTFISPTSLFAALSMVYNGADGETKEEIAKTLQSEGISVADLNEANAALMAMLDKDSKQIQLSMANSIWLNDEFHFQKDFAENNKGYFNAEIEEIDVLDKASAKKINDWVKKATNDKIEDMVDDPLDPNLVALLLNAIYFKGDWTYEFDKELTENRLFNLKDGTTKEVPLMSLSEELAYMENDDFQAVSLPYGEGEMSMKVFLPKENTNVEAFQQSMTAENWAAWDEEFIVKEGTILLPKFQLEYETLLNGALEKLGMSTAFDNRADFTKMIEEQESLSISEVKQKTFIDVNEEGTEAAAATSIGVRVTSALLDDPFYMEVNRPFFIAITDEETDMILFMGSIGNPQQAE